MNKKTLLKIIFLILFTVGITGTHVYAEETDTTCDNVEKDEICVELQEPLGDVTVIKGKSGVELIEQYISAIYKWGASMIGIVAVLNMVISGIQITTSADSERAANAKTRMLQSIAALCLLFLSGLLLYTINPNFFVNP